MNYLSSFFFNKSNGGIVSKPVEILMVEDSSADIRLTREALKEWKIKTHLHVVNNGMEALEFLHQKGEFSDKPRPDLILLDLNLPRMKGHELLSRIKNDIHLRRIPVVVFSTSTDRKDIANSYDLHANCFITKPVNFEQFTKVVKSIEDFWLSVAQIPD